MVTLTPLWALAAAAIVAKSAAADCSLPYAPLHDEGSADLSFAMDIFKPLNLTCYESSVDMLSTYTTREQAAAPDSQLWTHCAHCLVNFTGDNLHANDVLLTSNEVNSSQRSDRTFNTTPLAWSLWREFFHEHRNDRYNGRRVEMGDPSLFAELSTTEGLFVVSRPVFILPIITLHPGHILIDLVEQLYWAMRRAYGRVRKDALLVLDVASYSERSVLQTKLDVNINSPSADSVALMLALLSDLRVVSIHTLQEALRSIVVKGGGEGGRAYVVFRSLHLGTDMSPEATFFYTAARHAPCLMHSQHVARDGGTGSAPYSNMGNAKFAESARNYREFQRFILDGLADRNISHSSSDDIGDGGARSDVLFIQRSSSRVITNLGRIAAVARELGAATAELDPATTVFSEQLRLYSSASIIVCAGGTAAHNLLFLAPATPTASRPRQRRSLVLLLSRRWCSFAWIYAAQAALLDIDYHVYCDKEDDALGGRDMSAVDDEGVSRSTGAGWPHDEMRVSLGRRLDVQGPRLHKAANITADEQIFRGILQRLLSRGADAGEGEYGKRGDGIAEVLACPSEHLAAESSTASRGRATALSQALRTNIEDGASAATLASLARPLAVGLASASVLRRRAGGGGTVALVGEIAAHGASIRRLVSASSHMRVCIASPRQNNRSSSARAAEGCHALSQLNYYATLNIETATDVTPIHLWLEVSPGIRYAGSDVYVVLDLRLPHAGLLASSQTLVHTSIDERLNINGHRALMSYRGVITHGLMRGALAHFCAENSASVTEDSCLQVACHVQNVVYKREVFSALLRLRGPLPPPSEERPFVFLHIEKSAGTTIRELVAEAAMRLGLSHAIPCQGLPCETFDVPSAGGRRTYTVIAGHFQWVAALERDYVGRSSSAATSVLVMGRHPVDRVISYYYQRCYRSSTCPTRGRVLNSLLPSELESLVRTFREVGVVQQSTSEWIVLDDGMADAACRALSGTRRTTGLRGRGSMQLPPHEELGEQARAAAMRNIAKCVVGMVDDWEGTMRVLSYWFSWIDTSSGLARHRMRGPTGVETRDSLSSELYDVIIAFNQCDMALYERMSEIFRRQMRLLDTNYFS